MTRGNGVTTAYGYDSAWRLGSLAHSVPNAANNQTFTFGHNAAGQINSRASANSAYAWTGGYAATRNYSLNGQNQVTQTTSSGTTTYGYDGRGNLNSDGVNSYGYDLFNNLVSINSSTTTMRSDPAGRLMAVIDWSGGAATTASRWFRYGGSSLLAEYGMVGSDNNVLHQRYVPGPGVDETVVWYNIGDPNPRRWLTTDERGSVIAAADASGVVVGVNTYDEYGVPGASNIGRFQYTGQAWIPEVGLYHYKARDYSPTLGRFLQTDPIGYGDGMNWYGYAGDDPIDGRDPSGTENLGGYKMGLERIASHPGPKGLAASIALSNMGLAEWYASTAAGFGIGGSDGGGDSFGDTNVGTIAQVSAALDAGNQRLSQQALSGTADEVVVIGHRYNPNLTVHWSQTGQPGNGYNTCMAFGGSGAQCGAVSSAIGAQSNIVGGATLGTVATGVTAGAAIVVAPVVVEALGPSGSIFGRARLGGSSLFNVNANNALRIGWGWSGSAASGQSVFRISGTWLDAITGVERSHIDLWPWAK